LKNHSQILLMEIKKLKHKDISILKVDKETSMDVSKSRKFLVVETIDTKILTYLIESRKFLELDAANNDTSMELIEIDNQNVITNKDLLVKKHLENEFKKQFNIYKLCDDFHFIDH
jgi:hypothetical protein